MSLFFSKIKRIFNLGFLFVGMVSYGQITYTGIVVDQDKQPLSGVEIRLEKYPSIGTTSDFQGRFKIDLESETQVKITHLGYKTLILTLSEKFTTIILELDSELLNEVVISASREQQSRRDIPGAISVLSATTIENTKTVELEQLVNQVPGVFMSASTVASNEEHMMAVRSPITTKALFLYLEDGLPIRPTAVFNHNALLEMNGTSFQRIEVLKGPSSSIYGSDAIGGSFNFITKSPSRDFRSSVGFEINDMGLKRYELEMSQFTNEDFGFYFGGHYVERKNGPMAHSDYEKFALTFKTVHHLSNTTTWTNVIDLIDYRSDSNGDLSTEDYKNGNYESDQTFTERVAKSFRFRSTLSKTWSSKNKTNLNFIFRNNELGQIPFYRITQFKKDGQLTGKAIGEINSDKFRSIVGLIQHKLNFDFKKSSLILGASLDYTPQEYIANPIDIIVDTETGQNLDYQLNPGKFILNYTADISNYAGYLQYEISPIPALKITTALRYDKFEYNYNNLIETSAGAKDTYSTYNHFSPKLGVNYNFSSTLGTYTSYSNGFTPPQASDLYRNNFVETGGNIFELKPSTYHNFEVGGYYQPSFKFKFDLSLYLLNGENTLVSLRDESDNFFNANIGSTQSMGIEYGFKYQFLPQFSIAHNGSFASHRYIDFFDRGVDYSHTEMAAAPKILGQSRLNYTPTYLNELTIGLEYELVGGYKTSFEGQAVTNENLPTTATYPGHHVFNLSALYRTKKIELWGHLLNVFDTLYAVRSSYNVFRKENTFTVGSPRAFHFGIKYHL
ncbi:TonB-dependent receptor [Aequorivita sp. F47161]|uniref:TonB-dependent receptor n=1 Tax=Aequorivita vitellina TaxID=2874475 RepID=A0A9X1QYZ3_9FLAO|nr:TonB-dependent receptor [Aequorivita vitellina]MCG2419653.1 TonB-dependent receptor [Aequorivita vitellina]